MLAVETASFPVAQGNVSTDRRGATELPTARMALMKRGARLLLLPLVRTFIDTIHTKVLSVCGILAHEEGKETVLGTFFHGHKGNIGLSHFV